MPAAEVPCFEDPNYERGGVKKLRTLLEAGPSRKRTGVKRALWLSTRECPGRIAQHFPDAKLIAILRNPIDRAVSSLFQLMHGAKIPLLPADDALGQILDRSLQQDYPVADIVLEYGLYNQHIERYLEFFDRSQMLILLFDNLQKEPEAVSQSMYAFLEVDAAHRFAGSARRPMAAPYSHSRLRILRALLPTYSRLYGNGTRRAPRRGPLAPLLRGFAGGLDRFVLAPLLPAERPELTQTTRSRLVEYYRSDVTALSRLLDLDLTHWLADDA